ncbi:MAG TPA: cupin domain-containing protein [Longimicrobiales bacterium]|nr:cupin domain-containing protein [Longimicrobiales bacterium]
MERSLAADVLVFRLAEEQATVSASSRRGEGPAARTLVKNGPMRVTLISLAAGGEIKEHKAEGPITVHTLSGSIQFNTPEKSHDLAAGDLLSLGAGIRHSIASEQGATFLLTIAAPAANEAG